MLGGAVADGVELGHVFAHRLEAVADELADRALDVHVENVDVEFR